MDVQGFAGGRFGSVRQCFAEILAAQPVGFRNSATGAELGFMRPARTR